jgi:hypothetical protein
MLAAFFIKQPLDFRAAKESLLCGVESWIIRGTKANQAPAGEFVESWVGSERCSTGGTKLRDDLTAIGHEDFLAAAHEPEVFAEAILQLSNANGLHRTNVATCSY